MKIPETSANVGAYYGNEENGQWQVGPNGVIIDSGVGGGVVGSGDAGIHRPVYPVHHIPRGPHHMPGYVMAGAYYGPAGGGVGAGAAGYTHAHAHAHAPQPEDFSDYMWMENEEEFDKQVMQQLEEEALMEQCIEAMLEDEQRERGEHRAGNNAETSNGTSLSLEETVSRSTLNPLAAEFVPTFVSRRPASEKEDKTEPVAEVAATDATEAADTHTTENDTQPADRQTEVPEPQPDPPEVSAADIQPERVSRDNKKADKKTDKRPVKQDARKTKPAVTKSETKVQPKKKEAVKAVKSDSKLNDVSTPAVTPLTPVTPVTPVTPATPAPATVESSASVTKVEPSLPTPTPTPTADEPPSGPKPINYAAAAKANKPKKPTTAEKTPPPQPLPQPQPEKRPLVKAKDTKLPAKDRPRKNSAK